MTIVPINITEEIRGSFLTYSMSFILQRALPDARDGLKPSQRRILVAMDDLNLGPTGGYRKCAKIAGDTSGNYHPHGEAIVYPTLVHLAQPFRMRYPLVTGQGNFGSIDGYPPAAMRYTEARLNHPAVDVLRDFKANTVDFKQNYDETRAEPSVLPGRFPNLLCNGSIGIAVGMASKIPPHNLREIAAGLRHLMDHPEATVADLMQHVRGPDFPTGGIVHGVGGILQGYLTGRGIVQVRARAEVTETKKGREEIIITEIPYLVNKSVMLEKIGDLVRDKVVEGIANVRDESGRNGLRIVFEVRKDAMGEVVLSQLYKHSMLQTSFGINMVAIVNDRPVQLNLKRMMQAYIDHRLHVVVRKARHDIDRAHDRAHVVEGLRIALASIDEVIAIIRASSNTEEAGRALRDRFSLTERQSRAILDMPLHRLTSLEQGKLAAEYLELLRSIRTLQNILMHRHVQLDILRHDLEDMEARFGDDRRTAIVHDQADIEMEDLVADEDVVVTVTAAGYAKRTPLSQFRAQGRGGRGVTGMTTKEDDHLEHLFIASARATLLFLTSSGICHWLKVYRLPLADRSAKGRPLVNYIDAHSDPIRTVVPVRNFDEGYLVTATSKGIVKKTALSAYKNIRRDGIIALKCAEDDRLIGAAITDGRTDLMLLTRGGKAMRFPETEIRSMGRVSAGVKGISLRENDEVVEMLVIEGEDTEEVHVLTVCENGYGKRTATHDYPTKHRGGMGVIDIRAHDRNGPVVASKVVRTSDQVIIITREGVMIRTHVEGVSEYGRNTSGVRLIALDEGDQVIGIAPVIDRDEGNADEGNADEGNADEGNADEGNADEADANEADANEADANEADANEADANEAAEGGAS
jgi:DNA gyrase subunit A